MTPLTQSELIEGWWMEHRVQVLELAAYLDRLERSGTRDAEGDFRLLALRKALAVLGEAEAGRVERVQLLFSDPRSELLPELDRKGAFGAFDPDRDAAAGGPA